MKIETYRRADNLVAAHTWYVNVLPQLHVCSFREFAKGEYGTGVDPSLLTFRVSFAFLIWAGWVQIVYKPFWRRANG